LLDDATETTGEEVAGVGRAVGALEAVEDGFNSAETIEEAGDLGVACGEKGQETGAGLEGGHDTINNGVACNASDDAGDVNLAFGGGGGGAARSAEALEEAKSAVDSRDELLDLGVGRATEEGDTGLNSTHHVLDEGVALEAPEETLEAREEVAGGNSWCSGGGGWGSSSPSVALSNEVIEEVGGGCQRTDDGRSSRDDAEESDNLLESTVKGFGKGGALGFLDDAAEAAGDVTLDGGSAGLHNACRGNEGEKSVEASHW